MVHGSAPPQLACRSFAPPLRSRSRPPGRLPLASCLLAPPCSTAPAGWRPGQSDNAVSRARPLPPRSPFRPAYLPLITNRARQLAVFSPSRVLSLRVVQCSEPGSGGAMAAPPARILTPRKKPPAPPPGCAQAGVTGTRPPFTSPCGAEGARRAVAGGLHPPWRGRFRTSGGARQGVRAPPGALAASLLAAAAC